jgi:hypothetical protein
MRIVVFALMLVLAMPSMQSGSCSAPKAPVGTPTKCR